MTPIEIRPSFLQIFLWIFFLLAIIYFEIWPPANNGNRDIFRLMLSGGFSLWLVLRLWHETKLLLRVDENGVTVQTRRQRQLVKWSQIASLENSGEMYFLRDKDGKTLAFWETNWFNWSGTQRRKLDEIACLIQQKLRDLGRADTEAQRAIERWEQVQGARPFNNGQGLEVKTNYASLGWFFFAFCVLSAVFSFQTRTGNLTISAFFAVFSLLGIYLVLAETTFSADSVCLRTRSFFGKSRLNWDEVQKVEIGRGGQSLFFDAGQKRLVLGGPATWRKRNRAEMMTFLKAECAQRNLEWRFTVATPFFGSKNVRDNSL